MGSPSGAIPRSGCLRGEEDEDADPNMKGEIKSAIHMRPKFGFIFYFWVLPNAPTFLTFSLLSVICFSSKRARERTENHFVECGVIDKLVKIRKPQWMQALGALSSAKRRCFILHLLYLGSVSIFAPFAFIFAPFP